MFSSRSPGPSPTAAARNASATRSKARFATARKSAFLVPNRRTTYGCDTPARSAMRSVVAPSSPRRANSIAAAAVISVRRSSAVAVRVARSFLDMVSADYYYRPKVVIDQ